METVRALAAAGADVILAVRRPEAAEAVAREIAADAGGGRVEVEALDLSSFDGVAAFADRFLSGGTPLSFLVNNAGIMACPLARNAAGHESQLATNHLGHFLLTGLLAPALLKGAPARVVCLSSTGHRLSPIRFDDLHFEREPYDKWKAYGQSKTANALFALELDRRLSSAGVRAFSVHPGAIMTGLQKHLPREEMDAMGWLKPDGTPIDGFKSPAQGAATSVWAAAEPGLEAHGGAYLEDCGVAAPHAPGAKGFFRGFMPHAADPEAARRLWDLSEASVSRPFASF